MSWNWDDKDLMWLRQELQWTKEFYPVHKAYTKRPGVTKVLERKISDLEVEIKRREAKESEDSKLPIVPG